MKGTQYTQLMDPYATENAGLSPISDSNYNIGAQVNSCIPAGWWDFLFNNLVTRARQSYSDINVLYTEILNVLSAAGVTPSEADSTQLVQSLKTLFDEVPVATHNAVGKVKSSSGKGNVSVDSQTGVMTANGVGAMGDSTSGINSNPSVTDIISALAYLSRSMGGHQIAIPVKPENWQLDTSDYGYLPNSNETNPNTNSFYKFGDNPASYDGYPRGPYGVPVSGGNVCIATRGGARMYRTELTPGWYRICIWGGTGGKGGNSGGQPKGSYSGSSIGGSISGNIAVSGYSANAGADGHVGAAGYIDLYFPKTTKITGILGYGGNAGQSGGTPTTGGSGSPYVASGGSVGNMTVKQATLHWLGNATSTTWSTKDSWTSMATRNPSFIKGTAGSSGSSSGSITISESGSNYNYSGYCYYNGGGGGGANGGGTFIRIGDIPLFCHGGEGGAGAGHASKSWSQDAGGGGGSSHTYTIPATTGGSAASNYEGSIRAPLAMSSGFNGLVTDHPGVMDGTESWGNWVVRLSPNYYMSPCLKTAEITISSGTATINAGGATTTVSVPSGTSMTNGFPGGIAIFRGANI